MITYNVAYSLVEVRPANVLYLEIPSFMETSFRAVLLFFLYIGFHVNLLPEIPTYNGPLVAYG